MGRKMSINEIEDLFLQGDNRYSLAYARDLLDLLDSRALDTKVEDIPPIFIAESELEGIKGPQKYEKAVSIKLMEKYCVQFIGFEINLDWGIVDVLGKNKEGKLIIVECGPCRLNKIIDYFRMMEVKELWIVSYYYNEKKLIIIQRGKNWEEKIRQFDKQLETELRKIKSPLDNI